MTVTVSSFPIGSIHGKHYERLIEIDKANHTHDDEDFSEFVDGLHWDIEKVKSYCREDKVSGKVICNDADIPLGYCLFRLTKESFIIARFEMDKSSIYHDKIKNMMIDYLKDSLNRNKRTKIKFVVPDTELSLHLFLKEKKFVAKKVIRNYFDEIYADGYLFVYCLEEKSDKFME